MKKEQSSLGILIKALEGMSATVELRNEMEITGQVESVDWVMKYNSLNNPPHTNHMESGPRGSPAIKREDPLGWTWLLCELFG